LQIRADDTSTAINELIKVNGIGPAAARKFVDEGIKTIDGRYNKGYIRRQGSIEL